MTDASVVLPARANPFAAHRLRGEHYRLDEPGWAGLLAQLAALQHRAAIVGPHGAGKTTLLGDLGERLTALGWRVCRIRLSSAQRVVSRAWLDTIAPALGPREMILLDGCEQLTPLMWWRFRWRTRRAGGLIITSHREGRLPLLWRCTPAPDVLRAIVCSLGETLEPGTAAALLDRHHGNMRDALSELYDAASLRQPR